jgi:hypothetical protein
MLRILRSSDIEFAVNSESGMSLQNFTHFKRMTAKS